LVLRWRILQGSASRLRAILMTAAAMIFGIVPRAIGFGEGGAQSASLGRAVIGGLILYNSHHFAGRLCHPPEQCEGHIALFEPEDIQSRHYEAN